MYCDAVEFSNQCAECAVSGHGARLGHPLLQPIPVQKPFQIWGIDMELPVTKKGNRYVMVLQDFFTKWPFSNARPEESTAQEVDCG